MHKIPYSKVVCDGKELEYIREVLESGWLTTASKAHEFEARFAEAVDAKFACAVNSCTAALHLALEAIGIGLGDKVFVPTMTFTASAEIIRYLGADPVLLDVEYGTSLVTPDILAAAIERHPGVKALVIVHFAGQSATMMPGTDPGILDLCAKHGIRVVEDAAHAFPASDRGHKVGSMGDATCFSFYANKTITTGEGGMLVSDDEDLVQRARTMRLHGIDRDIWRRFTDDKSCWEYDIVAPGFKYNMADLNAAVGLAQLERAEEFRAGRERCAHFYLERLAEIDWMDLPCLHGAASEHAWHIFQIVIKPDAPLSRDACIERFAKSGIGTSVHYKPLHRMTYYRETYDLVPVDYPGAEAVWKGCLSLPIYHVLQDDELEIVCEALAGLAG